MHVVDLAYFADSQLTLECIAKETKMQDLITLDDFDNPLSAPAGSRVNSDNIDYVAYNLKSTLVSAKVVPRYLLVKDKVRKVLN